MNKKKISLVLILAIVLTLLPLESIGHIVAYAETIIDYREMALDEVDKPNAGMKVRIEHQDGTVSEQWTNADAYYLLNAKIGDTVRITDWSENYGGVIDYWDFQYYNPSADVKYTGLLPATKGGLIKEVTLDSAGKWEFYMCVRDSQTNESGYWENWSENGYHRSQRRLENGDLYYLYYLRVDIEVPEADEVFDTVRAKYVDENNVTIKADKTFQPTELGSYRVNADSINNYDLIEPSSGYYNVNITNEGKEHTATFKYKLKPGSINALITGPDEVEKGKKVTLDSSSSSSTYPIVQRKWYRRAGTGSSFFYRPEWDDRVMITDDIPEDTDRSYYEYKLVIYDSKGNIDEDTHRIDLVDKIDVSVNASLMFWEDQIAFDNPILITPEEYENNEELTIEAWITAENTTATKHSLGHFWYFADVTESEINHLKPEPRDDLTDLPNYMTYVSIQTRDNPEAIQETDRRGTFTFTPQNPTIKASVIVRNRNVSNDDENYDYATAYHTLDVKIYNPYPSISVTLDTSEDAGVGINVENLTESDIESKFPTSYTKWKLETLEGDLIMEDTGLVPSWIEYSDSFNKLDFFKVTQYAENTLGNEAYDTAIFALSPEFDFDVSPKLLFVGEEATAIDKSIGMFDKRWTIKGGNLEGTQELEIRKNNTFTMYEPEVYNVGFEADGYFSYDTNIYYYTNDKEILENEKPMGALSDIVEEEYGEEAIFVSGSQSWSGEVEEGNYIIEQLGQSNFKYRRSMNLQFIAKETRFNEKRIEFLSLKPIADLTISGHKKMYKEVFLNGSNSTKCGHPLLEERYPILFEHPNTQFIIEPLDDEGNVDINRNEFVLGNGKEIVDNKVVFSGKKFQSVRFDKEGTYRVKYKVYNGKEESDFVSQIIHIEPELYPTVDINVSNSIVYRNPNDELKTTIEVFVDHNSEDDEIDFERSKLFISFDKNNDMNFENDGEHSLQWVKLNEQYLVQIDNQQYITLEYISEDLTHFVLTIDNETKNLFGNFEFNFLAVEKPSIPNYTEVGFVPLIQSDTFNTEPSKKRVHIENMAPIIDLNTGNKKEVNIWILEVNGYKFNEQEISMLKGQLELERIKATIYIVDENNNVKVIE